MRSLLTTLAALAFSSAVMAAQPAAINEVAKAENPQIRADKAGCLHMVFEGFDKGSEIRDILYSKSTDKGTTWSEPHDISKTPGVSSTPAMAIEKNGAIDVIWRDTTSGELRPDIYFNRSADSGQSWGKAVDISNTPGVCTEPAIAIGPDDSIHAVWVDTSSNGGRPDIFYSSSTDGGKTWSKYEDISPTPGISREPVVAIGTDGIVHAAWVDTSSGEESPDIYYTKKVNGSWAAPIDISKSKKISAHPSMACGTKGRIFICWSDNTKKANAADIWCVVGRNGHFEKPINISDTPGVSSQPTVAADSTGQLAVAWTDTSSGISTPHIYTRVSKDSGDDFSNPIDITLKRGGTRNPTASIAGEKVVIAWEELEGNVTHIKTTSIDLKKISTGPVDQVDPTIHRVNR